MASAGAVPEGGRPPYREPVFWLVLTLAFGYGAVFNFLPVTFPVFRTAFGSTLEEMGRTQVLFFVSFLLFSVAGGWLIGRLGMRAAAAASVLLLSGGLATVGAAPSFGVVLAGALALGLGVASTTVVCYSIVNDHFGQRRQSVFFLLGIADAAGATVGPAALGEWIVHTNAAGGGWRAAYFVAAAFLLLPGVWAFFQAPATAASADGANQPGAGALRTMGAILAKPAIYGIALAIFLHGVAQMGMVTWTGQLYQKNLHIDAARAAYFISVNSAGFFAGRLLLSWMTARWKVPELLVLAGCAAGGTLAFAGTIAAGSYTTGLLFFTLAGFFISGDSPSINSYAGARFAGRSATAFSLMNGIGNIGGGAGPYLTGAIGNRFGLAAGIWLMPAFSAALAAMAVAWHLIAKRTQQSAAVRICA